MKLIIQEKIIKGMFGTLNVDYIKNSNINLLLEIKGHCNGITITIYKFCCYIWKACKRWCIRKFYIFGNILILKPIICTKE